MPATQPLPIRASDVGDKQVDSDLHTLFMVLQGGVGDTHLADNADIAQAKIHTPTLGYAQITSNFTSATQNAAVDVTGLTTTVTVPPGGRRIKITAYAADLSTSAADQTSLECIILEGATQLNETAFFSSGTSSNQPCQALYVGIATAGSHTYKVAIRQNGVGTMLLAAAATYPAFILCELI